MYRYKEYKFKIYIQSLKTKAKCGPFKAITNFCEINAGAL